MVDDKLTDIIRELVVDINKPKEKNPWVGQNWQAEDFKRFYDENFKGMSRTEIAKQNHAFYKVLWRRNLIDEIISNTKITMWKELTEDDLRKHYEDNYEGMSRTEVLRLGKEGSNFVQAVRARNLMNKIFPKNKRIPWKDFTEAELIDFYKENYNGLRVVDVRKSGGSNFIGVIRARGLMDKIFPERRDNSRKYVGWTVDEFKTHYEEHFSGMDRNQIKKKKGGSAFYQTVRAKGLLDDVIPKSSRKPKNYWYDFDNVKSALEETIETFGRIPKHEELRQYNSSLYNSIKKNHGGYRAVKQKLGL